MDRLIYSSLAAMRGAMARQTAVASNLANANTSGFRAEMTHAQSLWMSATGATTRATQASDIVAGADMRAGAVVSTGRDLDIAMNGDAMIAVQGDNGEEAYTKRGDLMTSPTGLLTTGDGRLVLGDGGPITLPPYDSLSIAQDGQIWIVPQGGDAKSPQSAERIKLATPVGSSIAKGMDGLFRVIGGGALPSDPDAKLTPKTLEGSNVNASSALVDMIDASRSWETQIKMLTTAQELDKSSTELMRLPE